MTADGLLNLLFNAGVVVSIAATMLSAVLAFSESAGPTEIATMTRRSIAPTVRSRSPSGVTPSG